MIQIQGAENYAETKMLAGSWQSAELPLIPPGWIVLALWTEQFDHQVHQPSTYVNNQYVTPPPMLAQQVRTCALIGRTEGAAIIEAEAKINAADKAARAFADELKAAKAELKKAKEDLDAVTVDHNRSVGEHKQLYGRYQTLRESNQKLEADMGKLREALGTKAIDQILGGK